MSIPNIDWDEWSRPSIEPFMEVVIHFPSGDVLLTDDEIANIYFNEVMFDNSHVLFGPPEPATGSLEIVDYDQIYNPITNEEVVENIQLDFYLGLWAQDMPSPFGPNIVSSFDQPILVNYNDESVYACVVYINDTYLMPGSSYKVTYTFSVNEVEETVQQIVDIPNYWFDWHKYAVVYPVNHTVESVVIQQQLYLGTESTGSSSHIGANIVTSFDQPILLQNTSETVYGCKIYINNADLISGNKYHITYTILEEGNTATIQESFDVQFDWFAQHEYAITYNKPYTVQTITVQPLIPLKQLYGIFFAQEWSYDTSTHSTTVDIINKIDELLTIDNRLDGLSPTTNQSLQTFLVALLNLSGHTWVNHLSSSNTVTLPYSFYEDTMASTLNNAIEALMASYIYAHDGIGHLFEESWYDTNVTLTDDDVESWEFMQSSIQTYDSVDVRAQLPSLKINEVLLSMDGQSVVHPNIYEYSASHVYKMVGIQTSVDASTIPYAAYNATWRNIMWRHTSTVTYDTFKVIGSVIDFAEQQVSVVGNRPYEISKNNYIPSTIYASQIASYLEDKIFENYFVLECSLRGCYGFWVGATIEVNSDLYGISGAYIIVGLDFSYNGAVHTNLTLHRID